MPKSTGKIRKKQRIIYMDYASSVAANPSSIHSLGVRAKRNLEESRKAVASVLSVRPKEIVFTSGGTESNNLAILGMKAGHIVTTNIEHASVFETVGKRGDATFVKVKANGIVDPSEIKKALKKNTVLVSVIYANNEIGTVQPIREIAKIIRHYRKMNNTSYPYFHIDAVQAGSYLDLSVDRLGVDLLTLSGSKIEGAAKVGVLYKRDRVSLTKVFYGGDQEFKLRPGTENVEAIEKFSKAFQLAQKIREKEGKRLTKLRDYFINKLEKISNAKIILNGDRRERLPNNINITVKNIPSDLLVIELSERGIMASAKSACKSGDNKVSHVIKAINPNIRETDGSLRFSFGRKTSKSDIDYTLKSLKEILDKLEKWYTR